MLRRAVGGTVVGNTMEWYDIGVYGYLAVTMGRVFLPGADPGLQVLFSLGVFASTYLARPLGGIFFGRLGDRVGRQKVLAATLILMAGATFVIGLLPSYATLGALAPVLLVVLKLVQGFSAGGEYAGATTFVSEYAPDARRGFFGSLLDFGSYLGFALGASIVTALQLALSEEQLLGWGWRLPFLFAGVIGSVSIYFRLRIEESPAFQATQDLHEANSAATADAEGRPRNTLHLVKLHWRSILIAFALVAAANSVGYTLTSYMPTYLTDSLGYDALHGTLLTVPVLLLLAVMLPAAGRASDRFGRRPVMWFGGGWMILLAFPTFWLIGRGTTVTTLLGLALLTVPVACGIACQASALPALFPTSSRYGGMGISFNIAVAVFGGTTPLIQEALVQWTGNDLVPAAYLVLTAVVGAIAVGLMKESARRPLPGAMPSVASEQEARELVAGQDENPDLEVSELPFPEAAEPAGR
ncbi:MFS transporter [Kineococcus rhizosphaerae]|uniref:Putative proline/betaine transporter n=1 Tax=Kineococcus rhizosphaerae TaxID=559628 RepID=A0A2T0R2A0_9ACTN|nr:MFS transporter [Kineococcus rhizosphaerae]PRY13932.1 MHS family proline/betaine transporter-like MFS transporter [Kineococcus rhizosphaerae]